MTKRKDDPNDYWKLPTACTPLDYHVAERIGVYEALVLRSIYQMGYWRKLNKGSDWWQGSYKYWRKTFPWLSTSSFRRIIAKLEKANLIEIRIDQDQGNHYRPVQETISRLLNDESFSIEEKKQSFAQTEQSGFAQTGQSSFAQSGTGFVQSGTGFVQTEQSLLTLVSLDPSLEPSLHQFAASKIAATEEQLQEPVLEVLDSKTEKQKSAGSLIFEAYQDAYLKRYGIEPLRNAKTNSICSQIAKQLPLDEAQAIMHFYLQQNVAFYLQRGHAIQLVLSDLQALRTNMLKNRAMSSREAYLADKQQAQKNTVEDYLENREELLKMFDDVFK